MRLLEWLLRRRLPGAAVDAILGDLVESADGRRRHVVWRGLGVALTYLFARPVPNAATSPLDGSTGSVGGSLRRDVVFGLRALRARPLPAAVAVATLALGIGANVAIFTLIQAILLRPLPVEDPAALVTTGTVFSLPDVADLADASGAVLEGLSAWTTSSGPMKLERDGTSSLGLVEMTTGNYFEVAGVRARLGRTLTPLDDTSGVPVAVISERLWRGQFGADPDVIGTEMRINDTPVTLVGVADDAFRGTRLNRDVAVWTPLALHADLARGSRRFFDLADRGTQWLRVMGRLRPGVTLEAAETVLLARAEQLDAEFDSPYLGDFEGLVPATTAAVGRRDEVQRFLFLMTAMVVAALLVACANASGLLVSRIAERRRELGMRMALGAARLRLIRQLVVESLVLSVLAGVVALAVARWTLALVGSLQIPGRIRVADLGAQTDTTVVLFAALLSILAGLAFGLVPALIATRTDPVLLIRDDGGSGAPRRQRLAQVLVVAQIALTTALVFGGGLFVRSLRTALDVDLGFDPAGVIAVDVEYGLGTRAEDESATFYRDMRASVRALPTVENASWSIFVPVGGGMRMEDFRVPGRAPQADDLSSVALNYVSPGYFETLGLPVPLGRTFADGDDAGGTPVVIVNETFADAVWPGSDPLGQTVTFPGPEGWQELTVIGVAANSKLRALDEPAAPYVYLPLPQWTWLIGADSMRLAVRTSGPTETLVEPLRQRLREQAPDVPIAGVVTLQEQLYDLIMPQRVGATLLGMYALLALVIAALGVYGIVSSAVASRTQEIGVRRALGAQRHSIARFVARHGIAPAVVGLVAGALLTVAVGNLLAGFVPGLSPRDPQTLVITTLLLGTAAVLASGLAARAAVRIDPVRALRAE